MRNIVSSLFILSISTIFLFACSEDDSDDTADSPRPSITLNGDANVTQSLNTKYIELGATATAAGGKDISSSVNISGAVDYNKTGLYKLTYTATDDNGKTSNPAVRNVTVKNDANYLEGMYTASHKCSSSFVNTDDFKTEISTSTEVNNKIFFSPLNPVSGQVEAVVNGTSLAIPQAFGANNIKHSGSGTISNKEIEIFFVTNANGYQNCTITLPR